MSRSDRTESGAHASREEAGPKLAAGRMTLAARILPPAFVGPRRARYLIERNLLIYRRSWMLVFSGFFEPLFYLFSIGIGIGGLVGEVTPGVGGAVNYVAFVAPALLAASAMNGAVYESTIALYFKLRHAKVYDVMVATPVRPLDIAVGEIAWSQMRGLAYALGFLAVMLLMGLVTTPLALLAIPGALLIGFAFAAVGMAAATFMSSWQHLDLVQLAILPLFLFSATFFPLSVYPEAIRPIVQLSPLYHGVALIRALTLGTAGWDVFGHVAFLAAMGGAGAWVASRRITAVLMP